MVRFQLALIKWREHLLKPHARVLINAILREVEKERRGEVLLTSRLRQIIECLVELGITSEQHSHSSPSGATQSQNEHLPGLMNASSMQRTPLGTSTNPVPQNPEWVSELLRSPNASFLPKLRVPHMYFINFILSLSRQLRPPLRILVNQHPGAILWTPKDPRLLYPPIEILKTPPCHKKHG